MTINTVSATFFIMASSFLATFISTDFGFLLRWATICAFVFAATMLGMRLQKELTADTE